MVGLDLPTSSFISSTFEYLADTPCSHSKYKPTVMADPRKRKDDYELVAVKSQDTTGKSNTAKAQPIGTLTYLLIIVSAIAIKSYQPIAISASQNEDGTYSYNKTTMVLLTEVAKLVACLIALGVQMSGVKPHMRSALTALSFTESLHFLVPAILYGASNTLAFIGMSFINPALFHVFGNIRIIVVGILSRLMKGAKMADIQWLALLFMTVGAIMATPGIANEDLMSKGNSILGLLLIILMCVCSSASSVYTEMNFKRTKELSIFYQNVVLYLYGILVNGIYLLATDLEMIQTNGFFYGYSRGAYLALFSQALMGVSLSFIFKYLDNIVYVISLTVSMIITIWLSIMFFGFELTIPFVCAVVVVIGSIYLYYR